MEFCNAQAYQAISAKQVFINTPIPAPHTVEVDETYIIDTVCREYDVTMADIKSQSRKREIVTARQIAMTLIGRYFPDTTLKHIGWMFGGRDHSTVIYSKETVADLCFTDKKYKEKYNQLVWTIDKRLGYRGLGFIRQNIH